MLRAIRQKLDAIDYYSADRERTGWTRLREAALPFTLLITLPVVALINLTVQQPVDGQEVTGAFHRNDDGTLIASFDDLEDNSTSTDASMNYGRDDEGRRYAGNFSLTTQHADRGWPLVTSIQQLPLAGSVNLIGSSSRLNFRALAADHHALQAINAAIEDARAPAVIRAADQSVHETSQFPIRWVGSAMIWWALLYLGLSVALIAAEFITTRIQRRIAFRARHLRKQGLCPTCGYDLRGLEFSERCPECGDLSW
ncbi:MAG: hypothetical protein EA377_00320 [Phycisphaerales bacterium]|nr:MAG: hypothetical protein EA377_00320 [Phycisphaerales bacterium]